MHTQRVGRQLDHKLHQGVGRDVVRRVRLGAGVRVGGIADPHRLHQPVGVEPLLRGGPQKFREPSHGGGPARLAQGGGKSHGKQWTPCSTKVVLSVML